MRCPFCAEAVDERAVVCKTCHRDFGPSKPLMEANHRLEAKVEALEGEVGDLRALIAVRERSFDPFTKPGSAMAGIATYVLLPVAMVIVLHFVLVVMMDANLAFLRVATAVVAMLCGYTLEAQRRPSWFATVCLAILVAVCAVLGMSATMSLFYRLPFLPDTRFDRLETGEYMASIGLAYLLGVLIALATKPLHIPRGHRAQGPAEAFAAFLANNLVHRDSEPVEKRTERWLKVIRFTLSVITAAGMLWTGFKRFFH